MVYLWLAYFHVDTSTGFAGTAALTSVASALLVIKKEQGIAEELSAIDRWMDGRMELDGLLYRKIDRDTR